MSTFIVYRTTYITPFQRLFLPEASPILSVSGSRAVALNAYRLGRNRPDQAFPKNRRCRDCAAGRAGSTSPAGVMSDRLAKRRFDEAREIKTS